VCKVRLPAGYRSRLWSQPDCRSLPAVNHQPEFTAHCVTAAADQAIVDGALAMIRTTIDIATDANLR
jgi:hypothetical protein